MNGVESIRATFDRADAIDRYEGSLAYYRYHDTAVRLAERFGVTLEQVAGCFAATSPNNDYMSNLRSVASLLKGWSSGAGIDRVTVSTYRAAAERAWRVLEGEHFLSFTEGLKTRSFYTNIVEPDNPEPVTIDGHLISIWHGKRMTMKEAVRFTGHYEEISAGVRAVADRIGLLPHQVQATLWFTWKRIHKPVRHDGQLYLFDPEDHWRTRLDPDEIKPFKDREIKPVIQPTLNLTTQQTLWPI